MVMEVLYKRRNVKLFILLGYASLSISHQFWMPCWDSLIKVILLKHVASVIGGTFQKEKKERKLHAATPKRGTSEARLFGQVSGKLFVTACFEAENQPTKFAFKFQSFLWPALPIAMLLGN
nr:hypothetical protein Iba_chr07eCG10130 [Ipomoea batatas]